MSIAVAAAPTVFRQQDPELSRGLCFFGDSVSESPSETLDAHEIATHHKRISSLERSSQQQFARIEQLEEYTAHLQHQLSLFLRTFSPAGTVRSLSPNAVDEQRKAGLRTQPHPPPTSSYPSTNTNATSQKSDSGPGSGSTSRLTPRRMPVSKSSTVIGSKPQPHPPTGVRTTRRGSAERPLSRQSQSQGQLRIQAQSSQLHPHSEQHAQHVSSSRCSSQERDGERSRSRSRSCSQEREHGTQHQPVGTSHAPAVSRSARAAIRVNAPYSPTHQSVSPPQHTVPHVALNFQRPAAPAHAPVSLTHAVATIALPPSAAIAASGTLSSHAHVLIPTLPERPRPHVPTFLHQPAVASAPFTSPGPAAYGSLAATLIAASAAPLLATPMPAQPGPESNQPAGRRIEELSTGSGPVRLSDAAASAAVISPSRMLPNSTQTLVNTLATPAGYGVFIPTVAVPSAAESSSLNPTRASRPRRKNIDYVLSIRPGEAGSSSSGRSSAAVEADHERTRRRKQRERESGGKSARVCKGGESSRKRCRVPGCHEARAADDKYCLVHHAADPRSNPNQRRMMSAGPGSGPGSGAGVERSRAKDSSKGEGRVIVTELDGGPDLEGTLASDP